MRGEAGIVKNELRRGGDRGREGRLFPMTADNEECFRLGGQGCSNRLEKALGGVPDVGRSAGPIHEEGSFSTWLFALAANVFR
jgi:hypothetical protein